MSTADQTGTRIRERRVDLGVKQAELAQAVGISASYLNLIEHNRRRISTKILTMVATQLAIAPEKLAQGVEPALVDQLCNAAADLSAGAEVARVADMAGRFPGWAALIKAQSDKIAALQAQITTMSDRMSYDPELANSLHEVISAVTAIRSTASILVGSEQLDADWQSRFHNNIYDDSRRLAERSEALIGYLDAPAQLQAPQISAIDQVETALAQTGFHISALEGAAPVHPAQVLASYDLAHPRAQTLLGDYLRDYAAAAQALPLDAFVSAAKGAGFDPSRLAQQFNKPIAMIMRRLAGLPSDAGLPPIGMAVCDASGSVILQKQVTGFALPRNGASCPLWPIYAAFSRPEQPLRAEAVLPGAAQSRLLCYAVAGQHGTAQFDSPPVMRATMLVLPDMPITQTQQVNVGLSCRICPRDACAARREPSILSGFDSAAV